ncbi:hypothetical protein [Sphingomonas gellani]|uniref:hypothetical protein n=1 Tax=Sphingomonas gellani TaxID=1166340 RepID=UPI001113B1FB|nr:hypothetical protein [Sphingomonas gellani]
MMFAFSSGVSAQIPVGTPGGMPTGAGLGSGLSAHDGDRDGGIADQVDRARQNQNTSRAPGKASNGGVAAAADLVTGASVFDRRGKQVGSIQAVSGASVVVAADGGAVAVPAEAFGKGSKGLMIDLTKAEFDKLVAGATGGK